MILASQESWLPILTPRYYTIEIFQGYSWRGQSLLSRSHGCDPAICPVSSSKNLVLHHYGSLQPKLLPAFTRSAMYSCLQAQGGPAECCFSLAPQLPGLGSYPQCTPETSRIACALQCCPSGEYGNGLNCPWQPGFPSWGSLTSGNIHAAAEFLSLIAPGWKSVTFSEDCFLSGNYCCILQPLPAVSAKAKKF